MTGHTCVPTYVPDLSQYDEIYDVCRKYTPNAAAITVYETKLISLCEGWHVQLLRTSHHVRVRRYSLNSSVKNVVYHTRLNVLIHELAHAALPSTGHLSPEV